MDAWQKTHVTLITPIANSLYKYNGDNRLLSKSSNDIKKMLIAVREGFNALRHIGTSITPVKLNFLYMPTFILVPVFRVLMGSKIAEVAIAKHANVTKDEMLQLQKEFKKIIEHSGVQTAMFDELTKYNQCKEED
jgi:2-dehydropantoate 2-reductase